MSNYRNDNYDQQAMWVVDFQDTISQDPMARAIHVLIDQQLGNVSKACKVMGVSRDTFNAINDLRACIRTSFAVSRACAEN